MRPSIPTISEVDDLATLLRTRIPSEWQDSNGHLNAAYYMHLYNGVADPMFESWGYLDQRRLQPHWSIFDLEYHIWYLREVHVGDEVSVHCRLMGRSEKRFHGTMLLANRTRHQLASALEFIATGADLKRRSSASLPPALAKELDAMIKIHAGLHWPCPMSGCMSP